MKRLGGILPGVIFLSISILILAGSSTITIIPRSRISSAAFPRIIGVAMVILSIVLIVLEIIQLRKKAHVEEGNKDISDDRKNRVFFSGEAILVVLTFALVAAYTFLLDKLGFVIATILYLIGQIMLLSPSEKRKKWPFFVLLSILTSVIVYCVFYYGFSLILPAGILR